MKTLSLPFDLDLYEKITEVLTAFEEKGYYTSEKREEVIDVYETLVDIQKNMAETIEENDINS